MTVAVAIGVAWPGHAQAEDPPYELLDDWTELDIEYDADRDGMVGKYRSGYVVDLTTTEAIESFARIFVSDGPLRKIKRVAVEVHSADGKLKKHSRKSLQWKNESSQSGLVFSLDVTRSHAFIPGLKKGDRVRVEFEYELKGTYGITGHYFGVSNAPCAKSSYTLVLPASHEAEFEFHGSASERERLEFHEEKISTKIHRRWTLVDIEAFSNRVLVVPHISRVGEELEPDAFAVGESWAQVGLGYLRRIEPLFEASNELKKEAQSVVAGLATDAERIDALYHHVQDRCRYLGLFDGLDGIIPRAATQVHQSRFGDCKGLGTLLISMLRSVEIDATPVLLLTRGQGQLDPEIPNMGRFNHFTVWADDGRGGLWLDPTYDGCPAGVVPNNNTEHPVLLLDPVEPRMVDIPDSLWACGTLKIEVEGSVDTSGQLSVDVTETSSGNTALRRRRWALAADQNERTDAVTRLLAPRTVAVEVATAELEADEDWNQSVVARLEATSKRSLPGTREQFFLPRELVPLPDIDTAEELRHERSFDLRLIPSRRETWTIAVPPGAIVDPDSFRVVGPGLEWNATLSPTVEGLTLRREIRLDSRMLPAKDLPEFARALTEARRREAGLITIRTTAR